MEKLLAVIAYFGAFAVVAWLCERYRPMIVLGGILLIIVVLT